MLRFAPLCILVACGLTLDLSPPEEPAGDAGPEESDAALDAALTDVAPDVVFQDSSPPTDVAAVDAMRPFDAGVPDAPRDAGAPDAGTPCRTAAECVGELGPCKVWICEVVCIASNRREAVSCDDGLFCTINTSCGMGDGVCGGGTPLACVQPGDPCQQSRCSEEANSCVQEPVIDGEACGIVNGSGECSAGVCNISSCDPAFERCEMSCIDTDTDSNNCGICGLTCELGTTCRGGACL